MTTMADYLMIVSEEAACQREFDAIGPVVSETMDDGILVRRETRLIVRGLPSVTRQTLRGSVMTEVTVKRDGALYMRTYFVDDLVVKQIKYVDDVEIEEQIYVDGVMYRVEYRGEPTSDAYMAYRPLTKITFLNARGELHDGKDGEAALVEFEYPPGGHAVTYHTHYTNGVKVGERT